jgi:hypothetical protein
MIYDNCSRAERAVPAFRLAHSNELMTARGGIVIGRPGGGANGKASTGSDRDRGQGSWPAHSAVIDRSDRGRRVVADWACRVGRVGYKHFTTCRGSEGLPTVNAGAGSCHDRGGGRRPPLQAATGRTNVKALKC